MAGAYCGGATVRGGTGQTGLGGIAGGENEGRTHRANCVSTWH